MSQYLIPARTVEDAREAVSLVPGIAKAGDQIVLVVISETPEAELTGSRPPESVMDPLATTGGTAAAGRAGADRPEFISSEEIMELRGREHVEALQPSIAELHREGFDARVQAVFSDDLSSTIRDLANDLQATGVFATESLQDSLDADERELVRSLRQ